MTARAAAIAGLLLALAAGPAQAHIPDSCENAMRQTAEGEARLGIAERALARASEDAVNDTERLPIPPAAISRLLFAFRDYHEAAQRASKADLALIQCIARGQRPK